MDHGIPIGESLILVGDKLLGAAGAIKMNHPPSVGGWYRRRVQGEKRHFQPIARLFVIKKKICGLFQPRSGYFQQPVSGGAVFLPSAAVRLRNSVRPALV
jgi:hypothetical protein